MEHFSLTANNDYVTESSGTTKPQAYWQAVTLNDLGLNRASQVVDNDFWPSRHKEYNRLEWDQMDWEAVRRELTRTAELVRGRQQTCPELEFEVPSMRERTFLEMWFGYGDPSVEARHNNDGSLDVGYGRHRICALADYPMSEHDRDLMRLPATGFTPEGPLAGNTCVPVIVHTA